MALKVLEPIVSWINGLASSSISYWLAIIGFGILAVIAIAYGLYGLVRLSKWVIGMRVKEFTLFLVILGVVLVGLAIVLP